MIGRGVRPYKNKSTCLIYDLTDEIHNICSFNVLGAIPDDSTFEWGEGEKLTSAVDRHKLTIDDVDVEYEAFDLYEKSDADDLYAVQSQKEMLDFYNIPWMADITMEQAAYLIFKTMLMRQNGIDSQKYWQEWRRVLPSSDTYIRETPAKQELW